MAPVAGTEDNTARGLGGATGGPAETGDPPVVPCPPDPLCRPSVKAPTPTATTAATTRTTTATRRAGWGGSTRIL